MANSDIFDSGIVKSRMARCFLSCAWIGFLFVAMIGLKPFASRLGIDHLADTAGIDWTRQFAQVGLFFLIVLVTFFHSADALRDLPQLITWPIIMVLAWCGLTLFWSPVPYIGFRRLVLTTSVIFSVFAAVQGLGPWPALRLFGFCMATLIFVSVVAIPFVPNAVHLPGEHDVKLVGAWRGIFYHKNHSGLISALFIITSFFLWRMGQGRAWLVAMVPGMILLVMSGSKTSLILCLPALITGLYLGKLKAARRELRTILTLFTVILLVSFLTLTLFAMNETITVLLDDPVAFTGRMTIWKTLWNVIVKSPFGGVGFGSIYHTGIRTNIINPTFAWLSLNAHGHNGYLDIMASTGITGCILALYAFVVNPFLQITRSKLKSTHVTAGLLYALLCFLIFHNLLETSFLERGRPAWVALLVVCAVAQTISRKSRRG